MPNEAGKDVQSGVVPAGHDSEEVEAQGGSLVQSGREPELLLLWAAKHRGLAFFCRLTGIAEFGTISCGPLVIRVSLRYMQLKGHEEADEEEDSDDDG